MYKHSKMPVRTGQNIMIKECRLCRADRGREKRTVNFKEGERGGGGGDQMERSCLGDSCLVKSDVETMRQIQTER